jgi:hypothetical protein
MAGRHFKKKKRSYILLLSIITCPHYNIPVNCYPPYTFNFPSTEIISLLHFYIHKKRFQKELEIEKRPCRLPAPQKLFENKCQKKP